MSIKDKRASGEDALLLVWVCNQITLITIKYLELQTRHFNLNYHCHPIKMPVDYSEKSYNKHTIQNVGFEAQVKSEGLPPPHWE